MVSFYTLHPSPPVLISHTSIMCLPMQEILILYIDYALPSCFLFWISRHVLTLSQRNTDPQSELSKKNTREKKNVLLPSVLCELPYHFAYIVLYMSK